MAEDIMAALLPALLSGGGNSGPNPDVMGAMQAMQNPFSQGVPSNAGPVGQIAQAIMPLLAGPAYAQQARQSQQQSQRDTLLKVLMLTKELKGIDLQDKKLQAEAEALGVNKDFMKRYMELHGAVHGDGKPGDDLLKDAEMTLGPKGATFKLGKKPSGASEIGLISQLTGGDPQASLDMLQQRRTDVAEAASGRIAQRSQDLVSQRETAKEQERLNKPAETTNTYAYDPMTGKRATGAKVADLESGKVIKISGNDMKALTNAKDAWRQLDRLEELSNELLPKSGGILKTPISLVSGATKEAFGDPKWREFDQLASFLKFPVLQATVRGRPPLAESRTIREVSKSDNQVSAKAKIDEFRAQLTGIMDVLGFAPTALDLTQKPPEAKPDESKSLGKANAGEIARQIKAMKEMGKTPAEQESILKSLYGDIDIDLR